MASTPRQQAVALTKAAIADDRLTMRQLAYEATPDEVEHLAVTAGWAVEALATLMAVDVDWLLGRMGDAADGRVA
jgi:hypothetical protein